MFKTLITQWMFGGFFGKAYVIFAAIVAIMVISTIVANRISNPRKKMDFIKKAKQDGTVSVGKLTCWTLHGYNGPTTHELEYMYMVDGKPLYVTYEKSVEIPKDERKDEMGADMLLMDIKLAMPLFYDKNNPKKVMSKLDVFTSYDGIHQIKTSKKNAYRDVEKIWLEPIDLSSTS